MNFGSKKGVPGKLLSGSYAKVSYYLKICEVKMKVVMLVKQARSPITTTIGGKHGNYKSRIRKIILAAF
ncbi:hypothetical protein COX76_00355, partial [Candidatus Kaiserbacteria bacterium CG_4_10_14_0_2_um_filter_50_16]